MNNNENNDLKKMLTVARETKGLSQRKLAKIIGIHHSSLNDLENGRIKKIDVDVLRRIAEELDLNLESVLAAAGYNQVVNSFKSKPAKSKKKKTEDLLNEYRQCKFDLLEDAYEKRTNVANCRAKLHQMMLLLEKYDYYKEIYPPEKILADVKQLYDDLEMSAEKYDYSKLPHDDI